MTSAFRIRIEYAQLTGTSVLKVSTIDEPLNNVNVAEDNARTWIADLLKLAYAQSQRQKKIRLLVNPASGSRKAVKSAQSIKPILTAARCQVDEQETRYRNHAAEIAQNIDVDTVDVIACCSGDGLPHEVFNGLAKREDAAEALRKVAVVQIPCGTGNALSWNLNGTGSCSLAALAVIKGIRMPLDLVSVTQGNKRTISFLSQAVGIVAEVDLGTENVRWMGSARLTYGFLVRLLGKTIYPCEVAYQTAMSDKAGIRAHYESVRSKSRQDQISRSMDAHGPPGDDQGSPQQDLVTSEATDTRISAEQNYPGLPPLKYGTVSSPLPVGWNLVPHPTLGNFYAGNMPLMAEDSTFFSASLPSDGLLDVLTMDGNIGRRKAIASFDATSNNTLFDLPYVNMRKVSAYRIVPKFGRWSSMADATYKHKENSSAAKEGKSKPQGGNNCSSTDYNVKAYEGPDNDRDKNGTPRKDGGFIAIDGEQYPFEPFQVEVHRGLGTVLSRTGYMYESRGPK